MEGKGEKDLKYESGRGNEIEQRLQKNTFSYNSDLLRC